MSQAKTSQLKAEVERWFKVHPKSRLRFIGLNRDMEALDFEVQPNYQFNLFYNPENLKPTQMTSESDEIQSWTQLLNVHLEENPHRGVTDFLSRAEDLLSTFLPGAEKPAEAATTGSVPVPTGDITANATAANGESQPNANPPTPTVLPETGTSGSDKGKDKANEAMDMEDKPLTVDDIKKQVESWIKSHRQVAVSLLGVHADRFQVDATIGPEYYPFQISFSPKWEPLFLLSDTKELQDYVSSVSEMIHTRRQGPDPMTLSAVLTALAKKFNSALGTNDDSKGWNDDIATIYNHAWKDRLVKRYNRDDEDVDLGPQVDPTLLDWEETIIPEVRKYLDRGGSPFYEIEEWVRRIRAQMMLGNDKALFFIAREILAGNKPPSGIIIYFPPELRKRNYTVFTSKPETTSYITTEGTKEATERIEQELKTIKEITNDSKDVAFSAGPSGQDLYHWHVRLRHFGYDTPLGQDLAEHALRVDSSKALAESANRVAQSEIVFEMKFPSDFPNSPPMLRLVRPGIKLLNKVQFGYGMVVESSVPPQAEKREEGAEGEDVNNSNNSKEGDGAQAMDEEQKKGKEREDSQKEGGGSESQDARPMDMEHHPEMPLSVSKEWEQVAPAKWKPSTSVFDLITDLRDSLIRGDARVDMDSAVPDYGLPTINAFWRRYFVRSPEALARPDVEQGGKIILPVSAIEEMMHEVDTLTSYTQNHLRSSGLGVGLGLPKESTYIFELTGKKPFRIYCGVLEFTANPGQVCVPRWIMNNLGLVEGDDVQVRRVKLQKGTFVKLQPHDASFHNSQDNPKAMLEWVLPNYVALTAGEDLVITHNNTQHHLNVLEVQPGWAISLIDTTLNLDFAPPLKGEISIPTTLDGGAKATTAPSTDAAASTPAATGAAAGTLDTSNMQEGIDYKVCDNCMHKIAIASFAVHQARCARINWRCEKCGTVVPRGQKDEHLREAHTPVECPQCSEVVDSGTLEKHKREDCKNRLVVCEWCELSMPYVNLFQHQMKCGELTEECPDCHMRVRRRDAAVHPVVCKSKQPPEKPGRYNFATANEDQWGYPLRKSTSAFICDKCSSACDSFDDLQVHMLTAHHGETPANESQTSQKENEKDEVPMATGQETSSANDQLPQSTPHPDSTTSTPSASHPPPRQCSAPGCNNLEGKKRFLVCGPCKQQGIKVPYCSGSCQLRDWDAGHQKICGKPPAAQPMDLEDKGNKAD